MRSKKITIFGSGALSVMLLTGILFAAEGDPPLEVPTLSQGRALLSRDVLHRQCRQAMMNSDWNNVAATAQKALLKEQDVFGEEFLGSSLTLLFLDMAESELGTTRSSASRLLSVFETDIKKLQSKFPKSKISSEPPEEFVRASELDKKLVRLIALEVKAKTTGESFQYDNLAIALADELLQFERGYDPTQSELPKLEKELQRLIQQETSEVLRQELELYLEDTRALEPKNVVHENGFVFLVGAEAAAKRDDQGLALKYARHAFEATAALNDQWWTDEERDGGLAVGQHLFQQLLDSKEEARMQGDWERVIALMKEAGQLTPHLKDPDSEHLPERAIQEAEALLQLDEKRRTEYLELVRTENELEPNPTDGNIRRVMDVAERRPQFIGEDNELVADDENMLAVLYSRRNEHRETVRWARRALHRYLAQRGPDSEQFKITANNYLTALVQTTNAGELQLDRELLAQLEETTRQVLATHGKTPVSAQFKLATNELKNRLDFNPEQNRHIRRLNDLEQKLNFQFNQQRFDLAVPLAEKCVELTEQTWGIDSWTYADNRRALANCLTNVGQSDRAIRILERIEKDFDRFPYNQTSDYGWFLHGYAFALQNQGGPDSIPAAINRLEKARALEQRVTGKLGAYADHTALLAETFRDRRDDSASALPLFQEAAQIYLEMAEEGKWGYCQALVNVGLCQTDLGSYEVANKSLQEALQIRREYDFQNPSLEAWNHWAIGNNAFFAHQFRESVDHFRNALDLKEQHTPNANDIDDVYGQMIRSACWANDLETQPLMDRFLRSATDRYGNQTIEFANACQTVSFYVASGPDPDADLETVAQRQAIRSLLNRAMAIYQRENKASSAQAIYALKGMVDASPDSPAERLRSYRHVIELAQTHEPVLWDAVGLTHITMSSIYQNILQSPEQSLDHCRLAKEALTRAFGDGSGPVADAMGGQADALVSLGDYDKAEELIFQSLDMVLLRGGNPVGQYMLLSKLYSRRGDYDMAEQYLYTARNELGQRKFSDTYDRKLRLTLGALAIKQRDFQRAKVIAEDTLAEASGDDRDASRARFTAREILGEALLGLKQYRQANELLAKVLRESEKEKSAVSGLASLDTRTAYARSCMFVGEQSTTQKLLLDQFREQVDRHNQSASRLTPRQQLTLRRAIETSMSAYLSFARATQEPAESVYNNIFDAKGIVSSRPHGKQAASKDPRRRELIERLTATSRKLSALLFGQSGSDTADIVDQIRELTSNRESIQLEIAKLDRQIVNRIDATSQELSLATFQKQLGDASLIDFILYEHSTLFSPDKTDSNFESQNTPQCLAFIITRDSVKVVDMGTVAELRRMIAQWRASLNAPATEIAEAEQALSEKIWSPIQAHLPSTGQLWIAADGPLQQLAFAAVGDGEGRFLIDHFTITMVPSPRYVMSKTEAEKSPASENLEDRILLVGDVDYRPRNEESTGDDIPAFELLAQSQPAVVGKAPRAFRGDSWNYLSGTAAEVDAIASMVKSSSDRTVVRTLSGHRANEATVSLLSPQSRILHFATHGFFAVGNENSPWQLQSLSRDAVMGFDPQLLTGLVLSGANGHPDDGSDDGILTAAEIGTLSLDQTQLAVLSACETALGETRSGEGVLGLQRALHMAGCKNVVASLWKVDDRATMILMTRFYENLWKQKMSVAQSLREAQLWMLDHPTEVFKPGSEDAERAGFNFGKRPQRSAPKTDRLPPRYWAAFSVSGNGS